MPEMGQLTESPDGTAGPTVDLRVRNWVVPLRSSADQCNMALGLQQLQFRKQNWLVFGGAGLLMVEED